MLWEMTYTLSQDDHISIKGYNSAEIYKTSIVKTLMQSLHSKQNSKPINKKVLSFSTLTPKQPETFKLRSLSN